MATQSSSSTRLLAVGTVVLLIGVALVLVIIRGSRGDTSPGGTAQPADTPTVEATEQARTDAESAAALGATVPSAIRIEDFDPVLVKEGFEAVAVKVPYDRAVASLPFPGDVLRIYRQPTVEVMNAANPIEAPSDDPLAAGQPQPEPTIPAQRPAPELVLDAVTVLAVIGPAPASNSDNRLTLVLEIRSEDVAQVIQLANDSEIWTTLLPRPEDDPSDAADS